MNFTISRTANLLKIQPGEGVLVALVTSIMFAANFGGAVGSPGIEALFYSRFGVEFLPYMYIILGLVSPLTSILMTGLMARVRATRLYMIMPLVMAILLVGARMLVVADLTWFYAVLWLGMNVFWILQSLFSWGSAGLVCDTRQAKRLFPLFGVGGIVGLALGSLATRPLVNVVGTENLLLFWSFGLLAAFILEQRVLSLGSVQLGSEFGRSDTGFLEHLKQSYRTVRSSSLLSWMAIAAVLFAVLYYSLVFPFATAVSNEYPDEASLAAFLGTFQGIATGVAVVASLFFANRLYSRFGFMTTILVYPIIYLVGFSIVAASASFAALTLFRFVQIFWSEGVSEGANQAMFNVVPPEKRERARTFIRGVANQFGVSLAGVVLLLGDRVLPTQYLYLIGAGAAAFTTYFVWNARKSYGAAVVSALRAGQSHIFYSEEQPFGGFRQDARAVATAVDGIHSPEIAVRRVAADILGRLSVTEATDAIVNALDDEDASVRVALLRALGSARASPALLEVAVLLEDPDPEVRQEAIATITKLTGYPKGVKEYLEPLLNDQDTAVRCQAAAALLQLEEHSEARSILVQLASADSDDGVDDGLEDRHEDGLEDALEDALEDEQRINDRIIALRVLADIGGQENYYIAAAGLDDPSPAIRRTSARLIANLDPELCLYPLQNALGDEDEYVRRAAAEALGKIGEPAVEVALVALNDPALEQGALLALQYLPIRRGSVELRDYIQSQAGMAVHYHQLWQHCRGFQDQYFENQSDEPAPGSMQFAQRSELLGDSLQQTARRHGTNALSAMGAAGNREGVFLAIENLSSPDATQRANALETLESIGDADIVRTVLPLWEPGNFSSGNMVSQWLLVVLKDDDSWIRACGALFAGLFISTGSGQSNGPLSKEEFDSLETALRRLLETDPEILVRESAGLIKDGGRLMDTMQTLTTMEKVLFLRQVPLFATLPPNDLKQIATVTGERAFSDGTIIAEQGEAGDVLYIIISGNVAVTAMAEDGSQLELGHREPGEYVGEMAVISDEVRMATLTAYGDVRTLCISRREFREILHLRPEASLAVINVLSTRLRELSQAKPG